MRWRRFEIYIKKINEIGGNEALLEKGERLKRANQEVWLCAAVVAICGVNKVAVNYT